jgi:hypothetical protein
LPQLRAYLRHLLHGGLLLLGNTCHLRFLSLLLLALLAALGIRKSHWKVAK